MKTILRTLVCTGAFALTVHGAEAPDVSPAAYVSAGVMASADGALHTETLPGASVAAWLEKPVEEVVFLQGDWTELLGEVHLLGDVSVLSGNGTVMHLATGQYDPFRGGDGHALVLNQGIDLRLFPGAWKYGAAVLPGGDAAPGFIFFDGTGTPVHRILLTSSSNTAEFETLVGAYTGEKPAIAPSSPVAEETVTPTEETKAAFLEAWRGLKDTHEFNSMLSTHKVSRTDALRLAEGEFTAQLDASTYSSIFSQLVDREISIMVFALNSGCVQISTGALTEINQTKDTLQLVERDSRTLVALPGVAEVWRVSKPTKKGLVYSLELYDAAGEAVAYIFGTRKGDDGNAEAFQELLYALPLSAPVVAAASSEAESTTCAATENCAKAKAASSEEETAPVSNGESDETAVAASEAVKVDTFNLPRRLRSQLNYTVKRLLEFDENGDEHLSESELPRRMNGVVAKGDRNQDALLDKDELTAMAYAQLQKREAAADREVEDKK